MLDAWGSTLCHGVGLADRGGRVVGVVGRNQVAAVEALIGVALIAVGAGLLAMGRYRWVEVEAIVPLMIALVAGQGVLEPDRAAPGAVQPDGEALVVQLQELVIASLGHGWLSGLLAATGE